MVSACHGRGAARKAQSPAGPGFGATREERGASLRRGFCRSRVTGRRQASPGRHDESARPPACHRCRSDIKTLRTVNETLIRTVEEVREIHREGMARRRQLSTELVDMREDLEKRLALPTAGNGTP
ncbi:toxic anion resistance protein [Pseudoxanthomonas mexicana]|uniref:toxic anion resistance protein n=1 Tax=Pseudoxanthomonas mexicana TaxID=128785 RepID=UPI001FD6BAF4|nr:toxic anion resistance protein [Pseudoxanthomonas mexicana]UOV02985.1 toxic anion resistance protein [Pseudoxanthomonas mexicana]